MFKSYNILSKLKSKNELIISISNGSFFYTERGSQLNQPL